MKDYKRKGIILLLLIAIVLSLISTTNTQAHQRNEHDEDLQKVLFVNGKIPEESDFLFGLITDAIYLCIDQYNGKGEDSLRNLQEAGISNLPSTIEEIDFPSNEHHRRYTHQGWNYNYTGEKDKAHWSTRKKILCATVSQVFGLDETSKKCDSFGAIVYYTHILGDLMGDAKFKGEAEQMPLAKAHLSGDDTDLFMELTTHLAILFDDQSRTWCYRGLYGKITTLAGKARQLVGSDGGINTEEKFVQYQQFEYDLMELLTSYVPRLLRKEEFFKNVFPVWE